MSIKIIDAMCGAGKTSYAIQMINDSSVGFGLKKFIYVTPFLDEVKRIKEQTNIKFIEPDARCGKGSKAKHVSSLVANGSNIVMTHELFARLDEDTLMAIENMNYVLIMDEVANVLDQENISRDDIRMLRNNKVIDIAEDGQVIWLDPLYVGVFSGLKVLSQKKNLFLHNGVILFWTMPVANFKAFKEVYILTYLFDGQIQRYYYDMHNLEYTKHSVVKNTENRYELVKYSRLLEERAIIKKLITIYEDYKQGKSVSRLNSNYLISANNPKTALSKSWFVNAEDEQIEQLRKNLINFFRTHCPTDNNKLFWTAPKDYAVDLKDKKCKFNKKDNRSKDNFVAFNIRATNEYSDRTAAAFVFNRFMNPNEKQFFEKRGVKVDEDLLAVSDLIQFLFRGCIRNGEPMSCYIPSERMRDLLKLWMNFEI